MTGTTPEANRPLTGDGVQYVDGYLDLNHVPSLGAFIGKSLATHVSGNRMPVMSGDNRQRIPAHIRERFDRDCQSVASDIIAYRLSRPTQPEPERDAVERVRYLADVMAEHWAVGARDLTVMSHDCGQHAVDIKAILSLLSTAERQRDEHRAALARIRDDYGLNHTSKWARDQALQSIGSGDAARSALNEGG